MDVKNIIKKDNKSDNKFILRKVLTELLKFNG